jgi:predicted RNA binding protein YcfA (HicA-like mRNA interferase family)
VARLRKLVERFLADPPDLRFDEVRSLLAAFGFVEVRASGSHHVFRDAEGRMIVVPRSGGWRVKRAYVRRIVELLNLETWHAEYRPWGR